MKNSVLQRVPIVFQGNPRFTREQTLRRLTMRKLGSNINTFLCLIVLALSPCAMAQMIQISNVEELYSAVNNSANAGTTLVLSPGTYMLSATDANGLPRPKGGRIEMLPDMSLIGVEGDRNA